MRIGSVSWIDFYFNNDIPLHNQAYHEILRFEIPQIGQGSFFIRFSLALLKYRVVEL